MSRHNGQRVHIEFRKADDSRCSFWADAPEGVTVGPSWARTVAERRSAGATKVKIIGRER